MRWVDANFLANENHMFLGGRWSLWRNFDALISPFNFLLMIFDLVTYLYIANFSARNVKYNLNIPLLNLPDIKSPISQKSCLKINSLPGCWHPLEDVEFVVPRNCRKRFSTSVNHSLINFKTLIPTNEHPIGFNFWAPHFYLFSLKGWSQWGAQWGSNKPWMPLLAQHWHRPVFCFSILLFVKACKWSSSYMLHFAKLQLAIFNCNRMAQK